MLTFLDRLFLLSKIQWTKLSTKKKLNLIFEKDIELAWHKVDKRGLKVFYTRPLLIYTYFGVDKHWLKEIQNVLHYSFDVQHVYISFVSVSVWERWSNQFWLISNGRESTVDLLTICESRFEALNTSCAHNWVC